MLVRIYFYVLVNYSIKVALLCELCWDFIGLKGFFKSQTDSSIKYPFSRPAWSEQGPLHPVCGFHGLAFNMSQWCLFQWSQPCIRLAKHPHTYICFFPFHTTLHKTKLSASHSFMLAWFNATHTNTYCIVVHRILLNSNEACLLSQHLLYWQICSRFLRRVRFLGWAQKVSPNSSSGCTMPGNVPHWHCVYFLLEQTSLIFKPRLLILMLQKASYILHYKLIYIYIYIIIIIKCVYTFKYY